MDMWTPLNELNQPLGHESHQVCENKVSLLNITSKKVSVLTLCPMAEKHGHHHGIGCTRPRAMMIVAGIYACRCVLSLVPAYEVCVCDWLDQMRGPLKTFHFHRNSTLSCTCGEAHGEK